MSKKTGMLVLLLSFLLSVMPGRADATPLVFTDMLGRQVTLTEPVERIVALEPSDCEILCALGCEEMLVGRGLYCDYPESVLSLPVVQSGLEANVEQILLLDPQVVLTSDMDHIPEVIAALESCGIRVVVSNADTIEGVYTAIRMIGLLTDKQQKAEEIIADMAGTFQVIREKCPKGDQSVYFEVSPLEWGLWTAGSGTFMSELAEICGMENAFSDVQGWMPISQEQVMVRNPDFIVLLTGMGDTAAEEVMARSGWDDIPAVREGKIYNADSNAITRPGPRLKDAAMELYQFLYGQSLTE